MGREKKNPRALRWFKGKRKSRSQIRRGGEMMIKKGRGTGVFWREKTVCIDYV